MGARQASAFARDRCRRAVGGRDLVLDAQSRIAPSHERFPQPPCTYRTIRYMYMYICICIYIPKGSDAHELFFSARVDLYIDSKASLRAMYVRWVVKM